MLSVGATDLWWSLETSRPVPLLSRWAASVYTLCFFYSSSVNESVAVTISQGPDTFTTLHKDFRKCMARVSETIPVLFVPGVKDVGVCPTPASLEQYHGLYGADYFGFWFGGEGFVGGRLLRDGAVKNSVMEWL